MTESTTAPAAARLLVVDDEPNIRELLGASLRHAGFVVETAADGEEALDLAARSRPDLLLLDVMMPGPDGFEVLRRLRAGGHQVPVLFLTARDATDDKVAGLMLGGDDYITKPFSLEEVIARIHTVLRRAAEPDIAGARPLVFADIAMNEVRHEVTKGGEPVALSPTEYNLLRYFLTNPARVISKTQILHAVWGDTSADVNVVESYVSYLRRKIDRAEPRLLHTVRGVGYLLREPR